ncbi:hypothetical protein QJS04_geneDACA020798 [Acorus gramineus]|uniref:Apple domain-containing protein n=1 Tax=Acorus gramineus TaxID=55184 RepID=A0AAV9BF01_ACOGR|nr:hypothetical protein QJS04_geneDACA020798 [Acorus gramineus]
MVCRKDKFFPTEDVSYFNYVDTRAAALNDTDAETCRTACLKNCSCKAALIRYGVNASHVNCYLPAQLFSLFSIKPDDVHYNSSAFIKIQIEPTTRSPASNSNKKVKASTILGHVFGALFGGILIIGIGFLLSRKGKDEKDTDGRKNLEHSKPGEITLLVDLLKIKAEDNNLSDIVDKENEDVQ